MLIGLTASDDICVGDATVYGNTISSDIEYIRRSLGVCTQQDVLFPLLTVYEHLILALSLKVISILIFCQSYVNLRIGC
jgi:ABC-type multidrug transport system ATPase subunit